VKLQDLQVEIRPRTTGQTVAIAARLLQHRPGPLLVAGALYVVPTLALALGLLLWLEVNPWWVWVITLLVAPLFSLPLTSAVGLLVFAPRVTFREMISMSLRRTFPFAVLFFLLRAAALIGLAALVVPGLYILRISWFLGPIVLLEQSPLGTSLRRARRFAIGYHGHVLGHAVNTGAVLGYAAVAWAALLYFVAVSLVGQAVEAIAPVAEYVHSTHLLGLIGLALALPLATLIWFFVYLDVRIRKEGWDLEIAFRARAAQLEGGRG
jgi:hypothetical protein